MTRRPRWLPEYEPRPHCRVRLFCFAYAGGSTAAFATWRARLPEAIEVCAVQLPGRQNRYDEPIPTEFDALLDAMEPALLPHFDMPFALYGHSFGALIAFEMARRARRHGREAAHLFVSGCRAPQLQAEQDKSYDLPDQEFEDYLRSLQGIPEQVLRKPALKRFFMPVIRADFRLFDLYPYRPEEPLACPISAYGAHADPMADQSHLRAWQTHTTAAFHLRMFQGGHFFISEHRAALLDDIARQLLPPS